MDDRKTKRRILNQKRRAYQKATVQQLVEILNLPSNTDMNSVLASAAEKLQKYKHSNSPSQIPRRSGKLPLLDQDRSPSPPSDGSGGSHGSSHGSRGSPTSSLYGSFQGTRHHRSRGSSTNETKSREEGDSSDSLTLANSPDSRALARPVSPTARMLPAWAYQRRACENEITYAINTADLSFVIIDVGEAVMTQMQVPEMMLRKMEKQRLRRFLSQRGPYLNLLQERRRLLLTLRRHTTRDHPDVNLLLLKLNSVEMKLANHPGGKNPNNCTTLIALASFCSGLDAKVCFNIVLRPMPINNLGQLMGVITMTAVRDPLTQNLIGMRQTVDLCPLPLDVKLEDIPGGVFYHLSEGIIDSCGYPAFGRTAGANVKVYPAADTSLTQPRKMLHTMTPEPASALLGDSPLAFVLDDLARYAAQFKEPRKVTEPRSDARRQQQSSQPVAKHGQPALEASKLRQASNAIRNSSPRMLQPINTMTRLRSPATPTSDDGFSFSGAPGSANGRSNHSGKGQAQASSAQLRRASNNPGVLPPLSPPLSFGNGSRGLNDPVAASDDQLFLFMGGEM